MDDTARLVRPSDLAALLRTRRERERSALVELHACLARLAETEGRRTAAEDALAQAEADRARGEAAIYEGLAAGTAALSPAELDGRRAALGALTDAVTAAQGGVLEAERAIVAAHAAIGEARAAHAQRLRDTSKWVQIEGRAGAARKRHADSVEEIETEDETSLRFRGALQRSARA